MFKKFCPKCGKRTDEFFKRLCIDCYLQSLKINNKIAKEIEISQCPICEDFLVKDKNSNLEESLNYSLKSLFKLLPLKEIKYKIKDEEIQLFLKLKINGKILRLKKERKLKINKRYCRFCKLKISGYYEGIIQLRLPEEKIDEIKEIIKSFERKNRMAFISKENKLKKGVDVFIGSKNVIHNLVKIIKKKFKYKIKITRKFYGYKKGKKVYKIILLISE